MSATSTSGKDVKKMPRFSTDRKNVRLIGSMWRDRRLVVFPLRRVDRDRAQVGAIGQEAESALHLLDFAADPAQLALNVQDVLEIAG